MKRICIFVLVLAAASSLSGCVSGEVKLGSGDNGRQVGLSRGQILAITLEANPSTGYTWEVAEVDSNILRQIGEIEFKPASTLVGAGGMQTIRFQAVSAGQTQLQLVYRRPWEKDVKPSGTFSVQVVVR